MSEAALDEAERVGAVFLGALDGGDAAALEAAVAGLAAAMDKVRARQDWRRDPALRAQAERILAQTEAARVRVNFLTDLTRRRLAAVQALRGEADAATYGRDGRQHSIF